MEDEVVRKTTLREVKILRILKHENIVQLKEVMPSATHLLLARLTVLNISVRNQSVRICYRWFSVAEYLSNWFGKCI
eukprot:3158142-Amphidinium_carterae.2